MAAVVVSLLAGLLMLLPGLALLFSFVNCSLGCANPGGPGLSPGQSAPGPPLAAWLEFGIAQTLLGSVVLAGALLLARTSWHLALGGLVILCSVFDLCLAVLSPGAAPPVGFLAGFVGGALMVASSRFPAPIPPVRAPGS